MSWDCGLLALLCLVRRQNQRPPLCWLETDNPSPSSMIFTNGINEGLAWNYAAMLLAVSDSSAFDTISCVRVMQEPSLHCKVGRLFPDADARRISCRPFSSLLILARLQEVAASRYLWGTLLAVLSTSIE